MLSKRTTFDTKESQSRQSYIVVQAILNCFHARVVYDVVTGTSAYYFWAGSPGIELRCEYEQHAVPEIIKHESRKRLNRVFPNPDSLEDQTLLPVR